MSEQTSTEDYHKGVDLTYIERINTLENELKQNPDDKKLLELAHLLNDSGLKDKAIEKYKIYMKSNPKDADVLVDMGVCYYELNQFEDAAKYMKQAISFQPRHQIAHLNLGIVSLSQQKLDEAKEWWKKAIELNPTNDVGKRAQELFNSH
jgi:Tfp pilus assembly protein PilF